MITRSAWTSFSALRFIPGPPSRRATLGAGPASHRPRILNLHPTHPRTPVAHAPPRIEAHGLRHCCGAGGAVGGGRRCRPRGDDGRRQVVAGAGGDVPRACVRVGVLPAAAPCASARSHRFGLRPPRAHPAGGCRLAAVGGGRRRPLPHGWQAAAVPRRPAGATALPGDGGRRALWAARGWGGRGAVALGGAGGAAAVGGATARVCGCGGGGGVPTQRTAAARPLWVWHGRRSPPLVCRRRAAAARVVVGDVVDVAKRTGSTCDD